MRDFVDFRFCSIPCVCPDWDLSLEIVHQQLSARVLQPTCETIATKVSFEKNLQSMVLIGCLHIMQTQFKNPGPEFPSLHEKFLFFRDILVSKLAL